MRKLVTFFIFTWVIFFGSSTTVKADVSICNDVQVTNSPFGEFVHESKDSLEIKMNASNLALGDYYLAIYDLEYPLYITDSPVAKSSEFNISATTTVLDPIVIDSAAAFQFEFGNAASQLNKRDYKHVYLYKTGLQNQLIPYCKLGTYTITYPTVTCSEPIGVYQTRVINGESKKCYYYNGAGCIESGSPFNVELNGVKGSKGGAWTNKLTMIGERQFPNLPWVRLTEENVQLDSSGNLNWVGPNLDSEGKARITIPSAVGNFYGIDVPGLPITGACTTPSEITISGRCNDECLQTPPSSGVASAAPYKICDQIKDISLQAKCKTCAGDTDQGGVWTAIGCISRDPIKITERLIQVGLGMGGGVALIMTLAGGFILSTSQGDPQKANQAKEMITNSVIGLLFVIFSVFILQFIGVTILNIPGFGGSGN